MNSQRFFQAPLYKSFNDYTDIQPLDGRDDQFTAKKNNSRQANECYEDKWYLLSRAGLYRAQVEKAMSEIYQNLLGYSTDIEILKKQDDYYVASRAIANYTPWFNSLSKLQLGADDSLLFNDNGKQKPIVGLGKICAMTNFFKDNDSAPGNFGFQLEENKNQYRGFKIDCEKALDFYEVEGNELKNNSDSNLDSSQTRERQEPESLELEVKGDSILFLKKDITKTAWFQKENEEMLNTIATTDFCVIENILRKNITSTPIESSWWIANHLDPEQKQKMISELTKLKPEDLKHYEIDFVIEKLRQQHIGLQKDRGYQPSNLSNAAA